MIPAIWSTPKLRRGSNYPMLSLFDEMNRLFDDAGTVTRTGAGNFVPSIDFRETPNEYVLSAEFPGMSKDEINIEIKENTITLSGEKRCHCEKKEGEKKEDTEDTNPFSALFSFMKGNKAEKSKDKGEKEEREESEYEKVARANALIAARRTCRKLYDIYKKAHQMPAFPGS